MSTWILGATSEVGRAVAENRARQGERLLLLGRNETALGQIGDALRAEFKAEVQYQLFDAGDPAQAQAVFDRAIKTAGPLGKLCICLGGSNLLSRKGAFGQDDAQGLIRSNYEFIVSFLLPATAYMLDHDRGNIAAIGSICGEYAFERKYLKAALHLGLQDRDEGLRALVYGTSKGALHSFLDGLAASLKTRNVYVGVVKPATMQKTAAESHSGVFKPITPRHVADALCRCLNADRSQVIFVPGFIRWVLLGMRCLPGWTVTLLLRLLHRRKT